MPHTRLVFAHSRHLAPSQCCKSMTHGYILACPQHPTPIKCCKTMALATQFWLTPSKPNPTECCEHVLFFAHPLHPTPSQCCKSMVLPTLLACTDPIKSCRHIQGRIVVCPGHTELTACHQTCGFRTSPGTHPQASAAKNLAAFLPLAHQILETNGTAHVASCGLELLGNRR